MDDLGIPRPRDPHDITGLLEVNRAGDKGAIHELAPLVYEELHQIAHQQLGRERPGHTLQTTGLVHEAFMKFVGLETNPVQRPHAHFFALSARLMRQILTDYAKRRQTAQATRGARAHRHPRRRRTGARQGRDRSRSSTSTGRSKSWPRSRTGRLASSNAGSLPG